MLTYIHGYNSIYWKGLIKRGLIDDTSGVKITQCITNPDSDCFNVIASENSELYEIIREAKRPFYVDRLQGGTFYHNYNFDQRLIVTYQNMLDDKFLGFQMHEWMSNLNSDWKRITEAGCTGGSENDINFAMLKKYPYRFPFLESHSSAEFAELTKPENVTQFIAQSKSLFKKRQQECNGLLLPADSYFMAPKIEIALGAKHLMPEIGGQIKNTRIQLAYTRGMACANKISWGVYYEPWGGEPFGVCNYKLDGMNEWNLPHSDEFVYEQYGENGGSSRSLQKRLHRYSFLSGANFISEEWGVSNTFYDWNDFELSPYGNAKKEFLDCVKKMPAFVPYNTIALVLPSNLTVLDIGYNDECPDRYLDMTVSATQAMQLKKIWENLRMIFGYSEKDSYIENGIIRNSKFPDVFDIIHDDNEEAIQQYDYIIDLTGDNCALNKYNNKCDIHDLEGLLSNLLPCYVEGNVHWLLSQTKDQWIITILNNNGVCRTTEKGDIHDKTADTVAKIKLKNHKYIQHIDGSTKISKTDTGYDVILPSGDWIIASINK